MFRFYQSQRSSHTLQSSQAALPASLYNTMMISQPAQANVVQIATSLAQNSSPSGAAVATFSQDRQIRCPSTASLSNVFALKSIQSNTNFPSSCRFPAAPQLLTKLVTGPMPCGAVMVPTTMFMGQVVTAFAPQQGQAQTISITQQPPAQTQEQQAQTQSQAAAGTTQQQGQAQAQLAQQQTQFLQVVFGGTGSY